MKRSTTRGALGPIAGLCATLIISLPVLAGRPVSVAPTTDTPSYVARLFSEPANRPEVQATPRLFFEANKGQAPEQVDFLSRGPNRVWFLSGDKATVSLDVSDEVGAGGSTRIPGASEAELLQRRRGCQIEKEEQARTHVS